MKRLFNFETRETSTFWVIYRYEKRLNQPETSNIPRNMECLEQDDLVLRIKWEKPYLILGITEFILHLMARIKSTSNIN